MQISQLREALSQKAEQAQSEIVTVQGLADQRLNKLKFEMAASIEEHARAMSLLQTEKDKEGERLRQEKDEALSVSKFEFIKQSTRETQ